VSLGLSVGLSVAVSLSVVMTVSMSVGLCLYSDASMNLYLRQNASPAVPAMPVTVDLDAPVAVIISVAVPRT
jgi:hypothetical protein